MMLSQDDPDPAIKNLFVTNKINATSEFLLTYSAEDIPD